MHSRWSTFVWAAVLLVPAVFLSLAASAQAPTRFELYAITETDAGTEQTLKALAGAGSTVVMDSRNGRVLVVATDEAHARIREALETINIPPVNVRIDVRFVGRSTQQNRGAAVDVRGRVVREEGWATTRFTVRPQVLHSTVSTAQDVQQSILVANGRSGFIAVGEEVPHLDWVVDYGIQRGCAVSRVDWRNVGAYLAAEPVVVGDGPLVRVRLTPELRGMVGDRPHHTRFAALSTEVVVSDGQTFQVGGLEQDQEFYSRFLAGFAHDGAVESFQIFLTPHILPPGSF